MNQTRRWWTGPAGCLLLALVAFPLLAQQTQPAAAPAQPAEAGVRNLAPGVLKPVDPQVRVDETFSRHSIVELLAVDPQFDFANQVPFRRDIWWLKFEYKPVRVMWIDVPQPNGKLQRQLVWYMVYKVTHPGKILHPVKDEQTGTWKIDPIAKPIRFIPKFTLLAPEVDKSYIDRVMPLAIGPIRQREDPNRPLLTTVEMCREIQPDESFWGVATWESIDPRVDRFSVYVEGLTNAYKWQDAEGAYQKDDPLLKGRSLGVKVLKLNFWRPGDEPKPTERDRDLSKEFKLGQPGVVDYQWVYLYKEGLPQGGSSPQ